MTTKAIKLLWLSMLSCALALVVGMPILVAQEEAAEGEDEGAAAAEAEAPAKPAAPALAGPKQAGQVTKQPLKKNLLSNGSFDNPEDALASWRYKYDLPGETQWYGDNHEHVDVVKEFKGRKNVLRLWGDISKITDRGEGVQVDSEFIPFEPGARYRISTWGITTGPDCRVYLIGYQWEPGVKPDHHPIWGELRKVYKGKVMRIDAKDGPFSGAPRTWKQGSMEFPMEKGSDESLKHLKHIKFISVHMIAIGGNGGEMFFDDVVLERIK